MLASWSVKILKGHELLLDTIASETGFSPGGSVKDFINFLSGSAQDPLDGLFLSEEGRRLAMEFIEKTIGYNIRVIKQIGAPQQRFCKVSIEGEVAPIFAALLNDCEGELPTNMETLIGLAMLNVQSDLNSVWVDGPRGRMLNWRARAKGFAIVAEPKSLATPVKRTISAILRLEGVGIDLVLSPPSILDSAGDVFIKTANCLTEIQGRLVHEAMSSTHPKWKFLSLYRVLENSYLQNIKISLVRDFDRDAAKAVEEAQKKLSAEVLQLIDLMRAKNIESEFINFNNEFENQLSTSNRYIYALDRSAKNDTNYGNKDLALKAAVRFYKIRCSIAHAGTSSVIYEQLPDANSAMVALLPHVEAIVYKCLDVGIA